MDLRSFFVRLGLKTDSAGFAEGMATVEGLKKGLEVVSELANKAVDFLKEQVAATVEAGVEAKRMGEIFGVNAQTFQKLAYSANMSEVSTEALTAATRKLAMNGIKDTTGYLIQMADRIAAMPEGAGRATVALEAFGRSGREMLPWLSKGGAAIRQMMKDAEDLGVVMDEGAIKDAEEYEQAQKKLGFQMQGIRNEVILPLIKTFAKFFEAISKIIKIVNDWAKQSKVLALALKAIGVTLAAIGIAAITGLVLVLTGVVVALTSAFAMLAIAMAIVLSPIAALYLALDDLYVFIKGGDSLIGRALHKWLGPFKTWKDALSLIWQKVKDEVHALVDEIKEAFAKLWDDMKHDAIKKVGRGLLGLVNFAANPTGTIANALHGGGGGSAVADVIGGGAASPGAAASIGIPPLIAAGSSSETNSKHTEIHAHMEIHNHGGDTEKTTRQLDDWFQSHLSAAAAATGG